MKVGSEVTGRDGLDVSIRVSPEVANEAGHPLPVGSPLGGFNPS